MRKCKRLIVAIYIVFIGIVFMASAVELPQFKSGLSAKVGMDVDMNALYSKADIAYNVIDHNDQHIIWKFSDTTGDWAFVNKDGTLVVASLAEFTTPVIDNLNKELNDIQSVIKLVGGTISDTNPWIWYPDDKKEFSILSYDFRKDFDLYLKIPNGTINQARLVVSGGDLSACGFIGSFISGQHYFIDGNEVSGCDQEPNKCGNFVGISCGEHSDVIGEESNLKVTPVDITKKIKSGRHNLAAKGIDNQHTMRLDLITSSIDKPIVLYSEDKSTWIEAEKRSKPMSELYALIMPTTTINTTVYINNSTSFPGIITGIDPTSFPKVKVNVFINTSCAKSEGLNKNDFKIKENDKNVTIDSVYFSGNASGKKLDLAVAFDDTGSMQPQINAMKSKVQSLIDQIRASGIDARYALVTFKDDVTVRTKWTNDTEVFKKTVNALVANGGGDEPEDSLDAIETVTSMPFRGDAQKVVLLITDAHAHSKGDGTAYSEYTKEVVMKDLKNNGVIFIPVSPTFMVPTKAVDLREIANEIQSVWIDMNSANFSDILENFKQIITGTYVIEYESPDVAPSTSKNVIVTVNKTGCAVGSASVSYTNPAKA